MGKLSGKRVIITGVGFKKLAFTFKDITTGEPSHTPIFIDGEEYKANIGAATALECAKAGAIVHMISRTESKLLAVKSRIKKEFSNSQVEYSVLDLENLEQTKSAINSIPTNLPLYRVQSVGLGAGTIQLKDDNPYLLIEDLSEDLIEAELSVLKNTVSLLQTLLPRFRKQKETRVCIISSMSAIRSVISGSMHMAAKGAISRFTNAAMIESHKDNIFITDIRPGAVDTGMYDNEKVQEAILKMYNTYGYTYSKNTIPYMPPSAVGEIIVDALSSKGHITSVNMVARGQFPHEGS